MPQGSEYLTSDIPSAAYFSAYGGRGAVRRGGGGRRAQFPLEPERVASMTADGAYDGDTVYDAVAEPRPDAVIIIPPRVTAINETRLVAANSRYRSDAWCRQPSGYDAIMTINAWAAVGS
jgi:hypothetical protein